MNLLQVGGSLEKRRMRTPRCWIKTWSPSKMPGILCSPVLLVKPHEPLLPFVFSHSHSCIPSTNDFLYFYSRQGTVLDLSAIPFFMIFQLKWFELQLWGLSCAVSSEPLWVPKHFVFQIKFGRLQLKRINEDVTYGIRKPGKSGINWVLQIDGHSGINPFPRLILGIFNRNTFCLINF